jgi:hypothetical protein
MSLVNRIRQAALASGIHFLASCALAILASALVFLVWFPYPYRDLSGGRELFLLVIGVDIVCGPLLTLVLFNPTKPKAELWRDMTLVVLIQLGALGYGLWTVWQARPLYLVLEVDRYKVVTRPVIDEAALVNLPSDLQPRWWAGPLVVGVRNPVDAKEREKIMFESVQGGRDYAERPEFYVHYVGAAAAKALAKARPLSVFLQKQPAQRAAANELAADKKADITQWLYLPVVARQDWVAVLDKQGQIQGFLKGDGF